MEMRSPLVGVARAHLAVVAFIVAAGVIGGIGMQLELWEPGARWNADHYNTMIGMHGLLAVAVMTPALAGCCGYLMLDARRSRLLTLVAWSAFAVFALGMCAAAAARVQPAGWTLYSPVEQPRVEDPAVFAAISFAVAGGLHAVLLGGMLVRAARGSTPAKLAPIGAFVVAVAVASTLAAVAVLDRGAVDDATITHVTTFAAMALAVAALAHHWRRAMPFVSAGAVPALLLQQISDRFVTVDDLHLHDTHFVVGQAHTQSLAIAFAVLAVVHAWSRSLTNREPRAWGVWLGTVATSAGMLVHGYASMRSGASGMPRRYWDYIPEFASRHQLATKGAIVAVAGMVVLVAAWLTARARTNTN